MQGVHAFEPKTKANIDLESFVAEDHFLRRINRVHFTRPVIYPRVDNGLLFRRTRPTFDRSGSLLPHATGGVLLRNREGSPPVRGSPLQPGLSLVLPVVAG